MSEAEAEKPKEEKKESKYLKRKQEIRAQTIKRVAENVEKARVQKEKADKNYPTQKKEFDADKVEEEIKKTRIETSYKNPVLQGWKPSQTIVPTAEEQIKDDEDLESILEEKKEQGRIGFPMVKAMYTKIRQLEKKLVNKVKRKTEENVYAKEDYRDIPDINAICSDGIGDVTEKLNILEDEFKVFKNLRIEADTLDTLESLKLLTPNEKDDYIKARNNLYQILEHKINPGEMPDLSQEIAIGAGIFGTLGSLFGIGIVGIIGGPISLGLICVGGGIVAGTITGFGVYDEEKNRIEKLDQKNLNEEYAKFLESLNPLKNIIEGVRKVEEPEGRPHAARIAEKNIQKIKYRVEELYKLARK